MRESMSFPSLRDTADRVRAVPLEAVLVLVGAKRDRHDTAKWHTSRGVLSVTEPKFMNWTRNFGGGGAIDLAMHLNGVGFKAAVDWLSDRFPAFTHSRPVDRLVRRRRLELPRRDAATLPRVRHYLVEKRRIPSSLVESLIERGSLYADRKGNAVFLLLGKDGRPVGAELRGTTRSPWYGMATGSRKDLGYFSPPVPNAAAVVLCESAIDAISCSVLHRRSLCISTVGARSSPRWLAPLIRTGLAVYCGFDSDTAGDTSAQDMIDLHPTVRRLRPPQKDWNAVLQSRSG
jgi:hypothetical protein